MSDFTQGKHFLQALAVYFVEMASLALKQFLDVRREKAPRHTRHTLSTLNTILKLPSLKLVLVMWNPPISLVDSTCRPMQGHTS